MGARVLGQGYLNRVAAPLLQDWLLPRWMRDQADPSSVCFVPRSVHNLMVNQTQRGWTALGLPGQAHTVESIIDRRGLLTPVPGGPSLDWWVEVDGSGLGIMCAGEQPAVVQRLQDRLPVVVTAFEAGGVRVSSEVWMLPLPGYDWVAMQVVLFNIADMPVTGTFRFALRPYNPEGISPVYDLEYDGRTLRADGRPGPITWPRPESWRLSGLSMGDLFRPGTGTRERSLHDPHGFAHGVLEYRFNIEPWEESEFLAFMPVARAAAPASGESASLFDMNYPAGDGPWTKPLPHPLAYSRAKAATTLEWHRLLNSGMSLNLPDRALQESWEANRAHLLALHDGPVITPGPDLYHSYWIRDAAVMACALSTHGYREAARQLVLGFLQHQGPSGAFMSQNSEWDGTGQVLWAAEQHLSLHPDNALRQAMRAPLEKGASWLANALAANRGLLPPGLSSEHFGPPDTYYWDDIWALAGLEAAHALLGHDWVCEAARALREKLLASFREHAKGDALPGAPDRNVDLSSLGTLAAWYPLGLFPTSDRYLHGTLAAVEKLFYEGALFVNTGHSGWGTYLNMRLAGCYSLLGSSRGWELMRWLLGHASPTYNWPEAIHTRSGSGSTGDGHHGWASAEWLLLVRSLLLRDEPGRVVLAPAVPLEWLQSAGSLSVERAPSTAGDVSYSLEWDSGGSALCLEVTSGSNTRAPLAWRLPDQPGRVSIDGRDIEFGGGTLELPPGARVVEYRQAG